jgi:hypothetical protein
MIQQPELDFEGTSHFSGWIRNNLPDSNTGFYVSDIDYYLFNVKLKKGLILEEKTHMGSVKLWQRDMYKRIQRWIRLGSVKDGWEWLGCHLIQFENTSPDDGAVYVDHKQVMREELIKFLSFG